jgi:hypothetical protein
LISRPAACASSGRVGCRTGAEQQWRDDGAMLGMGLLEEGGWRGAMVLVTCVTVWVSGKGLERNTCQKCKAQ